MTRKVGKIGFIDYLGIAIMIIGLLFAGSEVKSQERLLFPEDPLHLGNIKELGMDVHSQIELLKEDRDYYLDCQQVFKEKGNKEAYLQTSKILKRIETDLKNLQSPD